MHLCGRSNRDFSVVVGCPCHGNGLIERHDGPFHLKKDVEHRHLCPGDPRPHSMTSVNQYVIFGADVSLQRNGSGLQKLGNLWMLLCTHWSGQ